MQSLSRRRVAAYAAAQLAAGADTNKLSQQLAAYVVSQKRLSQWELLLTDIQAELARRYHTTSATVTSAFPLTDALRQKVTAFVQQQTGSKTVLLEEQIDTDLIGGVTIQTTDGFFDGSIRKQLQQLTTLTKDKE
ncbi:MAG TPA: ATP synthase F1 subunit delta [Verrucomicrobiae bacterium]|nr:ATP synthase F1 subunit delta [Verrucomicrobiae bacterium]